MTESPWKKWAGLDELVILGHSRRETVPSSRQILTYGETREWLTMLTMDIRHSGCIRCQWHCIGIHIVAWAFYASRLVRH